jgi:hypothetical protein
MENQTLRERLAEWTDWDFAAFQLSRSVGLMGPDVKFATDAKHVFWGGANPVGEALFNILRELVEAGVLEYRDEPDHQYRWNSAFVGSWERHEDGPAEVTDG